MTDTEKISQWILSDIHNNAPIYVDILKKVIPLYSNITASDISYSIQIEELLYVPNKEYLHILSTKNSAETLFLVKEYNKRYHLIVNNNVFSSNRIVPTIKRVSEYYSLTILNYAYILKHIRDLKLNSLLSSKDDVKKNSPEYSDTSNHSNISDIITLHTIELSQPSIKSNLSN